MGEALLSARDKCLQVKYTYDQYKIDVIFKNRHGYMVAIYSLNSEGKVEHTDKSNHHYITRHRY